MLKILRTQGCVFCYTAKQKKRNNCLDCLSHTGKIIECRFAETEDIFLNHEGTFGNQEGTITNVFLDADWLSTPAFKLVSLLKRILKKNFRNASLLSIILSFNTFGVE